MLSISNNWLKPRKRNVTLPRYNTLTQRRQSLMHALSLIYENNERFIYAFRTCILRGTNEILQKAAREYVVDRSKPNKPYLGRLELSSETQQTMTGK